MYRVHHSPRRDDDRRPESNACLAASPSHQCPLVDEVKRRAETHTCNSTPAPPRGNVLKLDYYRFPIATRRLRRGTTSLPALTTGRPANSRVDRSTRSL